MLEVPILYANRHRLFFSWKPISTSVHRVPSISWYSERHVRERCEGLYRVDPQADFPLAYLDNSFPFGQLQEPGF